MMVPGQLEDRIGEGLRDHVWTDPAMRKRKGSDPRLGKKDPRRPGFKEGQKIWILGQVFKRMSPLEVLPAKPANLTRRFLSKPDSAIVQLDWLSLSSSGVV